MLLNNLNKTWINGMHIIECQLELIDIALNEKSCTNIYISAIICHRKDLSPTVLIVF